MTKPNTETISGTDLQTAFDKFNTNSAAIDSVYFGSPRIVDTITDLKALSGAELSGAVVVTGTDGAGRGILRWDGSNTKTNDDQWIIEPTVGGTGRWLRLSPKEQAFSVDSIADLKTLPADLFESGIQVQVAYYSTEGDGGGGTFYWDSASTDTDNGGTIIQGIGITTGRWERLYSGAVNVRWFGAQGDDSTDDTSALQAVIDFQPRIIFIPAGTYQGNWTLPTSATSQIVGEGVGSVLKARTTSNPILTVTGFVNSGGNAGGRRIARLRFTGTANAGHGIDMQAPTSAENITEDCIFEHLNHAYSVNTSGTNSIQAHFWGNLFRNNNYDIYMKGGQINNLNTFFRNRHRTTKKCCYYIDGLHGNTWAENEMENGDGFAIILKGGAVDAANGVGEWNNLKAGWFESMAEAASVTLDDEGPVVPVMIWLNNNKLQCHGSVTSGFKVDGGRLRAEHLRAASPPEYSTWEAINGSIVEVDHISTDNLGGRIFQTDEDSVATIHSTHPTANQSNRFAMVEGALPTTFREDQINYCLNWDGSLNLSSGSGFITTLAETLGELPVFNVSLTNTDKLQFSVPVDAASTKWYVFGFAIRTREGSPQTVDIQNVTSGNQFLFQELNLYVSKPWRYFWCVFSSVGSTVSPKSLRFKVHNDSGTTNFDLAMLQYAEFDHRAFAEAWMREGNFADPRNHDIGNLLVQEQSNQPVDLSGWTEAHVAGSGSSNFGPRQLSLSTGATSSSTVARYIGGSLGFSPGQDPTLVNFNQPGGLAFTMTVGASTTNGHLRLSIGKNTGAGVGTLSLKGFALEIANLTASLYSHDGTSGSSDGSLALNANDVYRFAIYWNGEGSAELWINRTLVTTKTTNIPTGNTSLNDNLVQLETSNGSDTSDVHGILHNVVYYDKGL